MGIGVKFNFAVFGDHLGHHLEKWSLGQRKFSKLLICYLPRLILQKTIKTFCSIFF